MRNPYLIEGPANLSFSGGRTSGYMLAKILEAYDGKLPDDIFVLFANTGKERLETLRFVHDCETHFGARIRWVEFLLDEEGKPGWQEVGFNSASRNGEPFEALIRRKKYLPNTVARFCTVELKIRVMRDFMREQGFDHWTNIVGLRADEPTRVAKARERSDSGKERWTNALPLADAGVSERDVLQFWSEQPFDLGLRSFEGNCDACFLKGRAKLWEIERNHPGTLGWWIEREKDTSSTFSSRFGYDEIQRKAKEQPDLFSDIMSALEDDPAMDAECGLWCGSEADL